MDGCRSHQRHDSLQLGNLIRANDYGLLFGPDGVRRTTMRQITTNTAAVRNKFIQPGAPVVTVTPAHATNITTAAMMYGSMAFFWIARRAAPVIASNKLGYGEIYFLSR